MLRQITLVHEEATPKSVTIEVDVVEKFSLDDVKAGYNARASEKVDMANPREPHIWSDDIRRVVRAWNDRVGWHGFWRLPQHMAWVEDNPQRAKLAAGIMAGDPKIATKLEQDEDAIRLLEGMSPEMAQRALNIIQANLKKAGKSAQKVLGERDVEEQESGARAAAKPQEGRARDRSRSTQERLGGLATTRNRRGESALGGTIEDGSMGLRTSETTTGQDADLSGEDPGKRAQPARGARSSEASRSTSRSTKSARRGSGAAKSGSGRKR